MANIVYDNLAAATITYNDVQFGGNDAAYKSVPPVYSFNGSFKYDESGRAVVATRYLLTVIAYFYEANEGLMAISAAALKEKLSQPGKELKIVGLGTAFDTIASGTGLEWGPKPLAFDWKAIGGQLGFEVTWSVEFYVKECGSGVQHDPLAFTAFNFNTTWRHDYEGMGSRTISGYVEIASARGEWAASDIPAHVVDEVRDRINLVCPYGFRPVENSWQEDFSKSRLNFSVTHEALPGETLPEGCTRATGNLSFTSQGPGFAVSQVTMNMSVRTSPLLPASFAGTLFLAAALTKYGEMVNNNAGGTVLVDGISISNGKFDNARDTSCSISFTLVKCLATMMSAANLWKPIVQGSYDIWRASMSELWGNRGVNKLRSNVDEAVIIDLCSNVDAATVGASASQNPFLTGGPNFPRFTCPNVPEDGGWLRHEMQVKVLRKDEMTWHKKAFAYLPTPGDNGGQGQDGEKLSLGGPSYNQDQESQKHDVEHHGLPEVYVAVIFKGLRFVRKPTWPILKSVAGNPAYFLTSNIDSRWAFDILSCPVWYTGGYTIYRVNGYVPDVRIIGSEASCVAPFNRDQNA